MITVRAKIYGWLEVAIVTAFVWWLIGNCWAFAIPFWNVGTDTGGEMAAMMLSAIAIVTPLLLVFRIAEKIPFTRCLRVGVPMAIFLMSAVFATIVGKPSSLFSELVRDVTMIAVIVMFGSLMLAQLDEWWPQPSGGLA